MKSIIQRFFADESGATAIEYGLLAGLIGLAIIGSISYLGVFVWAVFAYISVALGGDMPPLPDSLGAPPPAAPPSELI